MRVQCFRPRATRGAGPRAHINVTTFTNFLTKLQFRLPACIYGSTMHPARLYGGFGQFFFSLLSVLVALKERKKERKNEKWPFF